MEDAPKKYDPNDDPTSKEYLSLHSAPWLTKHVASLLAIFALFLTFGLFFILIYFPLDPAKKDIAIYILGVLSAIITQIFSFYFGSSKDSEVKNRMLHRQMSKNNEKND
ncbi:MAG: hypothetical protein PHF86_05275 [Candidatus Nanoarchaeia archaeon]|jgi:VIT1/CCC1 family predicted Fe2+/Mn2+ transporter|nr:hypothetical protein [Candidatus Nanoarchaeia archaeon]